MIDDEIRKVILILYEKGKRKKQIARGLKINIKTVRKVINDGEKINIKKRCDKKRLDIDFLKKIYQECHGYAQRTHEKLTEEYNINIAYPTLTKILREEGISKDSKKLSDKVPDVPGEEFQHDTSPFILKINDKKHKVVCSALYFRYSKIRYVKFYKSFNRFNMKCFFYEALTFWGYVANRCIVDNTSLVVIGGTGTRAILSTEMVKFASTYGFEWLAHEKNHPNRKAGKERNFYTIETNFISGRIFNSFEDLNQQAFFWATERYAHRPLSKTRLIPIQLFENEKPFLRKLPEYIYPPYQPPVKRLIDQYGYISFDANYYVVPEKKSGNVDIIEYAHKIRIYQERKFLIEYNLPSFGSKNEIFYPDGKPIPRFKPKHINKPATEEEKVLRNIDVSISHYLDFILSTQCRLKFKSKYIRQLYRLSKKITNQIFLKVIQIADKYKVTNVEIIDSLISQIMRNELYNSTEETVSDDFKTRESYLTGMFSDDEDLPEIKDPDEDENNSEK